MRVGKSARVWVCIGACGLFALPRAARADAATETRLRDALRTATTQLRALEEEQVKAQAREAAQKEQLEALRAQLLASQAGAGRKAACAGAGAKEQVAQLEKANVQLSATLTQCQQAAGAAAAAAQAREDQRARAAGQVEALTAAAAASDVRAASVMRAGTAFLDWMSGAGGLCEPVLGLRRVEWETRAQDFRDRLLELKAPRGAMSDSRPEAQDASR